VRRNVVIDAGPSCSMVNLAKEKNNVKVGQNEMTIKNALQFQRKRSAIGEIKENSK
jgi:hypothetical protein